MIVDISLGASRNRIANISKQFSLLADAELIYVKIKLPFADLTLSVGAFLAIRKFEITDIAQVIENI